MRVIFSVILFLSCLALHVQNRHAQPVKTKKEKTASLVLAKIRALPEVKHFFRYANKNELPDVIIDETPGTTNNMRYRVKVGYSRYMFRSILIFQVDTKTFHIYYEDWGAEDMPAVISLNTWRLWRNDPRFGKPHTFKKDILVSLSK